MQTVTNASLLSLISQTSQRVQTAVSRATFDYSPVESVPEVKKSLLFRTVAAVVTGLVGMLVVAWVCPLAQSIAERVGASLLTSVHVALATMGLSIPVVLPLCVLGFRRAVGLNRTR